MAQLVALQGGRQELERDWVGLCDQYAASLFGKTQQVLALTKQNEILYDEIHRLQQIILGGTADELSELQ